MASASTSPLNPSYQSPPRSLQSMISSPTTIKKPVRFPLPPPSTPRASQSPRIVSSPSPSPSPRKTDTTPTRNGKIEANRSRRPRLSLPCSPPPSSSSSFPSSSSSNETLFITSPHSTSDSTTFTPNPRPPMITGRSKSYTTFSKLGGNYLPPVTPHEERARYLADKEEKERERWSMRWILKGLGRGGKERAVVQGDEESAIPHNEGRGISLKRGIEGEREPLLPQAEVQNSEYSYPEVPPSERHLQPLPKLSRECLISEFRCYGKHMLPPIIFFVFFVLTLAWWSYTRANSTGSGTGIGSGGSA